MPRKEPDERGDSHLDREQLFKVRSLRPYSEASLCLGDLLRVDVVHEGVPAPVDVPLREAEHVVFPHGFAVVLLVHQSQAVPHLREHPPLLVQRLQRLRLHEASDVQVLVTPLRLRVLAGALREGQDAEPEVPNRKLRRPHRGAYQLPEKKSKKVDSKCLFKL